MEEPTGGFRQLASSSKDLARCLLTIGENRLQLLTVELQEQRERLVCAFLLVIALAVFGLLAAMTLTAAIVVLFWPYWHAAPLLVLTGLYGAAALWIGRRFIGLLRDWQSFSASLDQLRKDRACLEKILA
jgi:uncharacterized membrane protein YqjE